MHFDGRTPTAIPNEEPAVVPAVATGRTRQPEQNTTSLLEELNNLALTPNNTTEIRRIDHRPVTYRVQDGTTLSLIQTILFYPFEISYKIFNKIFYFLSTIFPFIPRLTGYYPANRTAIHSVQKDYDPKDNAISTIQAFEETYGQCGLKFYEDGFSKAYDEAKKDLKFLVIILQSDEHDLAEPFNRQVLTDPRVVEFLKRDDKIVWLGNVGNAEGFQIAKSLNCTSYPFVVLAAPSPKAANSSVVVMKSLVSVQSEEKDPMHFISTLQERIEDHIPVRATLVHDKREREMGRRLREEQDMAYQKSLEADRERARCAQEEKERKQFEENERKTREENEKQQAEFLEQQKSEWKLWRLAQLGPEFVPNSPEVRAARISIRTTDGSRLIRKFPGTGTIEDIYAYVECFDLLESLDEKKLTDIYESPSRYEKPKDYTHQYQFNLASSMPRKVIEPLDNVLIQTEKSIWPSGSLVVEEELSDEEDDE